MKYNWPLNNIGCRAPTLQAVKHLHITYSWLSISTVSPLSTDLTNYGLCGTVIFTIEIDPHINGPTQFKLTLFKDQLYTEKYLYLPIYPISPHFCENLIYYTYTKIHVLFYLFSFFSFFHWNIMVCDISVNARKVWRRDHNFFRLLHEQRFFLLAGSILDIFPLPLFSHSCCREIAIKCLLKKRENMGDTFYFTANY